MKTIFYPSVTFVFILAFIAFIPVRPALAHKVIVFAWVEDGMIKSESSFGSKRKAQGCVITMMDDKGLLIQTGRTDEEGKYAFKIPENVDSDLILKLEAGSGHQGQWRVSKNEFLIPASGNDIDAGMKKKEKMEEKEKLEKSPSALKIISGIGLIFLMALAAKYLNSRKTRK